MEKYNGSLIRKFPGNVSGNAYVGASITVYIAGTSGKAILYAANDVSGAQLANPLTSDDNGNYSFYAANGRYRLEFGTGQPDLEILLLDGDITDAQEAAADAAASAAAAAISADAAEDAAAIAILYPEGQFAAYTALIAKIKSKATLIADFVRNEFKVWEAPYGQEPKQLTDVVTTTRASNGTVNTPFGLETRAANIARITYDPLTGEPLGMLCEEARTNLGLHSADLTQSNHLKIRSTATATKLIEDTSNNNHYVTENISYVSGTTYCKWYVVSAAERSNVTIEFSNVNGAFATSVARFDLTSGTFVNLSCLSAGMIDYGSGNWLIYATESATATAVGNVRLYLMSGSTTTVYLGDGTSGVNVLRQQAEASSYPTSYIPTTTAAVTRVADRSKAARTATPNAATIYADVEVLSSNANNLFTEVIRLCDTTPTNLRGFGLQFDNDIFRAVYRDNVGTAPGIPSVNVTNTKGNHKVAACFDFESNIIKLAANGVVSSVALGANEPLTTYSGFMHLGDSGNIVGGTYVAGSVIIKESLSIPRALSDAEMITLTQG